jgi:hypothetical protein
MGYSMTTIELVNHDNRHKPLNMVLMPSAVVEAV